MLMRYFLMALCLLEVLLITWFRNIAGPFISPLLLLDTSMAVGLLYFLIQLQDKEIKTTVPKKEAAINPHNIVIAQVAAFIIISSLVLLRLYFVFHSVYHGNEDNHSDIIPQIVYFVNRFNAGLQPYYTIHFPGYDLFPTYLPLQWMPYLIAEWTHMDYRWIPALFLWLASLYFFIRNYKLSDPSTPTVIKIFLPTWPLIVWLILVKHNSDMFRFTVEALVAAYYLVVATSIGQRRTMPLAMGIAACLLSRYSIIFWVPLCIACYLLAGEKKKAVVIVLTCLAFFGVFYWWPFLRKEPSVFLAGYQYHSIAAVREWTRDMAVSDGKVYIYNGLGFTSWAIKFGHGSLEQVVATYQRVHLAACSITIISLLAYYIRKRRIIPTDAFLLFSFKVYLAIFYAFIQIPYKYLFFVPLIVSSALVAGVWKMNDTAAK